MKRLKDSIHGRVVVQFVIEKDGKATHIQILRGVANSLNSVAKRIIEHLPKWTPGFNGNNEPIRVSYVLPITFHDLSKPNMMLLYADKIDYTPPRQVDRSRIYEKVDSMPQFPGGPQRLLDYLRRVTKYPKDALELGISGKVYVNYVVDTTGAITNIKLFRGVYPSLDEEAIRVVKTMPNWTPGYVNGHKVRVRYTIPIKFYTRNTPTGTPFIPYCNASEREIKKIDQQPQFPGGKVELIKFIQKNLRYPQAAFINNIKGQVLVYFEVSKNGKLSHIKVYEGHHALLETEALRVVKLMPKWEPGIDKGEKVKSQYVLPITFKL